MKVTEQKTILIIRSDSRFLQYQLTLFRRKSKNGISCKYIVTIKMKAMKQKCMGKKWV